MRYPNKWALNNYSSLKKILNEHGTSKLSEILNVSPSTLRKWYKNETAPNWRFQIAINNLNTNFLTLSKEHLKCRILEYLKFHNLDQTFLSEMFDVSEETANKYISGRSKPRSMKKLKAILINPYPDNFWNSRFQTFQTTYFEPNSINLSYT